MLQLWLQSIHVIKQNIVSCSWFVSCLWTMRQIVHLFSLTNASESVGNSPISLQEIHRNLWRIPNRIFMNKNQFFWLITPFILHSSFEWINQPCVMSWQNNTVGGKGQIISNEGQMANDPNIVEPRRGKRVKILNRKYFACQHI